MHPLNSTCLAAFGLWLLLVAGTILLLLGRFRAFSPHLCPGLLYCCYILPALTVKKHKNMPSLRALDRRTLRWDSAALQVLHDGRTKKETPKKRRTHLQIFKGDLKPGSQHCRIISGITPGQFRIVFVLRG